MIYNFPKHISGDTWDGINIISLKTNESAINLLDSIINIQVRSNANLASPIVFEFSTLDNSIIILSPSQGLINIPPQTIDIPAGYYKYDLQIIFSSGIKKTYLTGNWEILPNITR
jgi:hypothetical protein